MTATATLKTARIHLDTPAELAGHLGHRVSQAVVVETSKPAAAAALGISLHKFNKWADWEPETHDIAAQVPGTVVWRSLDAEADDDSFSWWYLTDENIPVEIPWGQFAEDDEPEDDEDEGYSTLVGLDATEGPQVLIASRRIDLDDEPEVDLELPEGDPDAEVPLPARPLVQYTDDGTRSFDDLEPAPLPVPDENGVITLTADQAETLREREAAADEANLDDDLALAVELMAALNRQDPDEAAKVIAREDSVQRQMWLTAARVARRFHTR